MVSGDRLSGASVGSGGVDDSLITELCMSGHSGGILTFAR